LQLVLVLFSHDVPEKLTVTHLVGVRLERALGHFFLFEFLHHFVLADLAMVLVRGEVEGLWEGRLLGALVRAADAQTGGQELVAVWVIDVVFVSVHRKLVVDAEDLSLSKTLVFILLFLQFLQLKVATQTFHNDDLLVVVHDARVRPRLEGTLIQLSHFLLPPLHRNPLMPFFKLHPDSILMI